MNTAVFGYEVFGYDYNRDRTIQTAIAAVGKNRGISDAVKAQLVQDGSPGAERSTDSLSGMVSASPVQGSDTVVISAAALIPTRRLRWPTPSPPSSSCIARTQSELRWLRPGTL